MSRHELASRQGDLHERGVEVAVFYRGPYRCHHRPKPTTARFLQTEDSGLATDPYLDVAGGVVQGAASGTGKAVPRLVLAVTASFRYVQYLRLSQNSVLSEKCKRPELPVVHRGREARRTT